MDYDYAYPYLYIHVLKIGTYNNISLFVYKRKKTMPLFSLNAHVFLLTDISLIKQDILNILRNFKRVFFFTIKMFYSYGFNIPYFSFILLCIKKR